MTKIIDFKEFMRDLSEKVIEFIINYSCGPTQVIRTTKATLWLIDWKMISGVLLL